MIVDILKGIKGDQRFGTLTVYLIIRSLFGVHTFCYINIIMQTTYEKKFLREHRLQYHALKALVHQKHQIRINFSRSHTYQLLQVQLSHPLSSHMTTISLKEPPQNPQNNDAHNKEDRFPQPNPSPFSTRAPHHNLLEVIHRSGNRLAALGESDNKPLMRNSTMSRTYRRKKNNHYRPSHNYQHKLNQTNPELGSHSPSAATIQVSARLQDPNRLEERNRSLDVLADLSQEKVCFSRPRFCSSLPIKHNRRPISSQDIQQIGGKLHSFIKKTERPAFYIAKKQNLVKGQSGTHAKVQRLSLNNRVLEQTASNYSLEKQIRSVQISKRKVQQQSETRGEGSCRPWSSHKERDSQLKDEQNSLLAAPLK